MNSSKTVTAELGLRLIVPQQTTVPLIASLLYSAEDPYAIRIAFHVGLDEPVEWIFARELLAAGTEGRDGLGDVQVWPSAATASALGQVLNIQLSSPSARPTSRPRSRRSASSWAAPTALSPRAPKATMSTSKPSSPTSSTKRDRRANPSVPGPPRTLACLRGN